MTEHDIADDPLGAALRTVCERARHDIDWTGHPLMAVYRQHSRVKIQCSEAGVKGYAKRKGKLCSASQPLA